jgi:hypothetical protein
MKWKTPDYEYGLAKSGVALNDSGSSSLKVVLHPVRWSRGHSTQSIFVEELSTLISSLLSTKPMQTRGTLLLRLANGLALQPATGGQYKIRVTLSCLIERLPGP